VFPNQIIKSTKSCFLYSFLTPSYFTDKFPTSSKCQIIPSLAIILLLLRFNHKNNLKTMMIIRSYITENKLNSQEKFSSGLDGSIISKQGNSVYKDHFNIFFPNTALLQTHRDETFFFPDVLLYMYYYYDYIILFCLVCLCFPTTLSAVRDHHILVHGTIKKDTSH
jgi:hypothetical protein